MKRSRALALTAFLFAFVTAICVHTAEIDLKKPWTVMGTVVTESGQALEGVDIIAHTGIGSLRVGGRTVSDADGTFELGFAPGFYSTNPEGVQAATISAHKEGWFETNLYRQGDLLAAFKLPKGEIGWGKKTADDVILPGHPGTLKFTMARAGTISGVLADARGAPLANKRVGLTGDELPPSSSVFVEVKTNEKGGFEFKNVPTTFKLKLYAESEANWRQWPSVTIRLGAPKQFKVRLEAGRETFDFQSEPEMDGLQISPREEKD